MTSGADDDLTWSRLLHARTPADASRLEVLDGSGEDPLTSLYLRDPDGNLIEISHRG